jgi:hypothetical protein
MDARQKHSGMTKRFAIASMERISTFSLIQSEQAAAIDFCVSLCSRGIIN